MSHSVGVTHTDENGSEGYVVLKFYGVSVDPGKSPRMNPPGKAHDGWPPHVNGIDDIEVKESEFDHKVDPDEVYESHQEYFDEELLEKEGKRAAASAPEYDPARDGRW